MLGMGRRPGRGPGWKAILVWAAAGLAGAPAVRADDGPLQLHFFGTVGAARSSSDRVQYVRDLSQPSGVAGGASATPDSVLGVQADRSFGDRLNVAAQAVSRYRYDGSWRPELMWAYARINDEQGNRWRFGRLGTDFYMLADSRLVGYANLAARPSPDFFGQLPLYHIDGADLSRTVPMGEGLLTGKLFAGYTGEYVPLGARYWNMGDSPMVGANLDYHHDAWSFRLGYAQLRLRHDWPLGADLAPLRATGVPGAIAAADALSLSGKTSRYYSFGIVYDNNPLQVQLMANAVQQESYAYQNYRSAYLLAGYRLGALTPYGGLSRSYSARKALDTGLPAANPLNGLVSYVLDLSHTHQTTYTAGLRWDFRRDMDLKIQWDAIRGRADARFLYRNDRPGWDGDSDVLSLTLDFAF